MTGHSFRTGYLLTDTNFYKGSGSACSDLVKQGDYSASSGTCKVGHPRVSLILATVCMYFRKCKPTDGSTYHALAQLLMFAQELNVLIIDFQKYPMQTRTCPKASSKSLCNLLVLLHVHCQRHVCRGDNLAGAARVR